MKLYSKSIPVKDNEEVNSIEVYITYSKGGTNFFNGNIEKRGYYLHVQPSKVMDGMRSYIPTEGYRALLLEVQRQSNKKLGEAIELIDEPLKKILEELGKIYNFI